MSKVRWILSPDTFGENLVRLKEEIIRQGHEYIEIEKYFQFRASYMLSKIDDNNIPVISYGSIESIQHILRHSAAYPGAYCDLNKFKCSHYYPRLIKFLLNSDHIFLPFGELKPMKEWIYSNFGMDRTVFLRPDNGAKSFTGMTVAKEIFEKELDNIRMNPEDMVVVARPVDIDEEYRLVFCNSQYITGSMYKKNGKLNKVNEDSIPIEVFVLARTAAIEFSPEPAFVIDVGMTFRGPKIIELNSFSCSGLYLCNMEKIVRYVSKTVEEDWKDIYA